ncbi:MAG: hypothetical protein GY696_25945, partial [Gammaproteobacteria bacterium]|nr:hypothetical protein [Gammaproteobacteria bacterium]
MAFGGGHQDTYLPYEHSPATCLWDDWERTFKLNIQTWCDERENQISLRKLTLAGAITQAQNDILDELRPTEPQKIRKLLSGLGSEGFRQFSLRHSDWDASNLGNKTLDEALELCQSIFRDKVHFLRKRFDLSHRHRKPKETLADFVQELRSLAKRGRFALPCTDTPEEVRITEALIYNSNDEELLGKILEKVPDNCANFPPLKDILELVSLHEATKREINVKKKENESSRRSLNPILSNSDNDSVASSDSEEDTFFVKSKDKKGRT